MFLGELPQSSMIFKFCPACGLELVESEFGKHKASRDELSGVCLDCARRRQRERRLAMTPEERSKELWVRKNVLRPRKECTTCKTVKAWGFFREGEPVCKRCSPRRPSQTPTANRIVQLRIKYGMTIEDYDKMLAKQGGHCAICDATTPGHAGHAYLYVDHNHSTGKVRGLLCHHCNASIGHMKESEELLFKLIDYLREHRKTS